MRLAIAASMEGSSSSSSSSSGGASGRRGKDNPSQPSDGAAADLELAMALVVISSKVKFQRSEELDLITVSEFPDAAVLPHGFVIHFPEGPKYYKSTSAKDRDDFLDHFYNTTATLTETQSQRMAELKRVHGGPR
eukprot:gene17280-11666_t